MWRNALVILLTAFVVKFSPLFLHSPLPLNLQGTTDSKFDQVRKAFRENFEFGWEEEGAAFSVYHKGKLVVDLWGGYADESSNRKWRQDTLTVALSATKAIASLCVALLVERGILNYNSLVTEYWPEFGNNGKHNITVGMLLHHQAGLAVFNSVIEKEQIENVELISKIIENQTPNWPPGTETGYHAFTFGFLVDQLVRRTDKKHRSVGVFFREEIAKPNNIDFHIGLPTELEYRVTRLSQEGIFGFLGQIMEDPRFLKKIFSLITQRRSLSAKLLETMPWASTFGRMTLNDPQLHQTQMSSVLGIGTARALAKTFSLLLPEEKLFSLKTVNQIRKPVAVDYVDQVLGIKDEPRGFGFMYTKRPNNNTKQDDDWLIGHSGFGGQYVKVDLKNHLSFAYLTNSLKAETGDKSRNWAKLQKTLYKCI